MDRTLGSTHKLLLVPMTAIEYLYLEKLAQEKGRSAANLIREAFGLREREIGKPSAREKRDRIRYERRLCESLGLDANIYCEPDPGSEDQYAAPPRRPVGRPRLPLPAPSPDDLARYEMRRQMNEYNRQRGVTHLPRLPESPEEERDERLRARAEKRANRQ